MSASPVVAYVRNRELVLGQRSTIPTVDEESAAAALLEALGPAWCRRLAVELERRLVPGGT